MSHTFDPDGAHQLEGLDRFRYLSRDEIVGALEVGPNGRIADIGSGTGFYTREIAPYAGTVYAVDLQDEMHAHFSEREIPQNVELVLSPASSLPFANGALDGVVSTMTFHELESRASEEFARVLASDGSLVISDWSAAGDGARGPSLSERKSAEESKAVLQSVGFEVLRAEERPETFLIKARRQ